LSLGFEFLLTLSGRASRLWIDEIIDPIKTREYISVGIEISNNSISNDKFNVGLIQV
jgi:acetyl-CoA carboxylase carboxyltransferase component